MDFNVELENKIKRAEGMLVGLVLKKPDTLEEYDINKNLLSDEALFYIGITDRLVGKGITVIDEVSIANEIDSTPVLWDMYQEMGGYNTVKELKGITNENNMDAIYDDFAKWNIVKRYKEKGVLDLEKHWNKILQMKSSQVVDYMEYQITNEDININTDITFEKLDLTDTEISNILSGANIGLNFGKHSPILNYLTLGLPVSNLTMISSFTNGGKSSYVSENIVYPLAEQKIKGVIISNEQQSMVYKLLLMEHVLTDDLKYYNLPRKKLKKGNWSDTDKEMIEKARAIIKEKYSPYITFAKTYDYDMKKVSKIAKREAKRGAKYLVYDTMKYSGEDDSAWMSLLSDSKDLFQICSKLEIAGVVTFQLYTGLKNKQRIIDESALSNCKQVAEVFSEMIGFRDIWDDERDPNDKFYIHPYRFKKDKDGNFTKEKEEIVLDKDKKYKIFFHFKTRNDEVGKCVLYEFVGHINKWKELGYCTVAQQNRY